MWLICKISEFVDETVELILCKLVVLAVLAPAVVFMVLLCHLLLGLGQPTEMVCSRMQV